jgi:hypothetical protein
MPPTTDLVPRYAAEPPQAPAPHGRFADKLRAEFIVAVAELDGIGEPGVLSFFPDRTWHGHTYIPVTAATEEGLEVYGYVMFAAPPDGEEPTDYAAYADFTEETAERNPDWKLDLCDEVIGSWRGTGGAVASMTLIWGRAMLAGGSVVTAELGANSVDECTLVGDRFTMIAPDDFAGDLLEVHLYSADGGELAHESLYAEE